MRKVLAVATLSTAVIVGLAVLAGKLFDIEFDYDEDDEYDDCEKCDEDCNKVSKD